MDTVIITGANGEPALSIARRLCELGMRVCALAGTIPDAGLGPDEVVPVPCDPTSPESVEAAVNAVLQKEKRIAGIVLAGQYLSEERFEAVSAEEIIEIVKHSPPGQCGIFADTDYQAWELIRQARRAGIVPGREFYLVGYDNLEFSAFTDPPLTTIHQEFREEGRRAIRILLKIIYNMEFEHSTLIRPTLVRRATA